MSSRRTVFAEEVLGFLRSDVVVINAQGVFYILKTAN